MLKLFNRKTERDKEESKKKRLARNKEKAQKLAQKKRKIPTGSLTQPPQISIKRRLHNIIDQDYANAGLQTRSARQAQSDAKAAERSRRNSFKRALRKNKKRLERKNTKKRKNEIDQTHSRDLDEMSRISKRQRMEAEDMVDDLIYYPSMEHSSTHELRRSPPPVE